METGVCSTCARLVKLTLYTSAPLAQILADPLRPERDHYNERAAGTAPVHRWRRGPRPVRSGPPGTVHGTCERSAGKPGLQKQEPWELFDLMGGTSTGGYGISFRLVEVTVADLRQSHSDTTRPPAYAA
jgi:hypothetical protein